MGSKHLKDIPSWLEKHYVQNKRTISIVERVYRYDKIASSFSCPFCGLGNVAVFFQVKTFYFPSAKPPCKIMGLKNVVTLIATVSLMAAWLRFRTLSAVRNTICCLPVWHPSSIISVDFQGPNPDFILGS